MSAEPGKPSGEVKYTQVWYDPEVYVIVGNEAYARDQIPWAFAVVDSLIPFLDGPVKLKLPEPVMEAWRKGPNRGG